MEVLGLIPARSGSKGLKNKNIQKLLGKPLIEYTINSAKKSRYLNKIIVSTDSKKIAKIGLDLGVDVPFIRPKKLAQDDSSTLSVIKHTLDFLSKKYDYAPDIITILQPTSPLRKTKTIDQSIELLIKTDATMVLGVHTIKSNSYASFALRKNYLKPVKKDFEKYHQRQKFPNFYFPTGSVYTFWGKTLKKYGSIYGPRIKPLIIDDKTIIDIDNKLDLFLCEMIMKYKR